LGIRCQINFGKGLITFGKKNSRILHYIIYFANIYIYTVQWYPFQSRKRNDDEPLHTTEIGLLNKRLDERLPIDDEEDDFPYEQHHPQQFIGDKIGEYSYNESIILRASMERVDYIPHQVKVDRYLGNNKLNSIEITSSTGVQRVAMQPILSTTVVDTNTIVKSTSIQQSQFQGSKIIMESDITDTDSYSVQSSRPPPSYTAATGTVMILSRSSSSEKR
jgi:hypothetical protein